jgi:hypothetical protein
MALTGPALSPWHTAVDCSKIAGAGHRAMWVPATEGMATVQPRFHDHWSAAAAAGLQRGALHRLTPCYAGRGQARHFVATIGDPKGLLTAVTVEPDGPRLDDPVPGVDQLADFATAFRDLTGGHPLIIRTNHRWWPLGRQWSWNRGPEVSPYLWHHDSGWAWRARAGDPSAMRRWGSYGGWTFPTIWSITRSDCAGVAGSCTIAIFPGDDVALAELLDVDVSDEATGPAPPSPRRLLGQLLRWWRGPPANLS